MVHFRLHRSRYSCRFLECFESVRSITRAAESRRYSGIFDVKPSSNYKYEKLWRDLLSDPSQWWDNRAGKPSQRFPDFRHKQTGEGLWIIDVRNPSWVESEISAISPSLRVFSPASRLSRNNKSREYEKTIEHFEQMVQEGIVADGYVFVHVLNACAALRLLKEGRRIHGRVIVAGCELNPHVSRCLINMYARCGRIDEAWRVFDRVPSRNVFTWSAMIRGCAKCGQPLKSLELFEQMQREGIHPNSDAFIGLANACASLGAGALEVGRRVHVQVIRGGFEADVYVGNSLLDMYCKCGSIDDAWSVFNSMPTRNVVAWTAMIMGCVKCGQGRKALQLFPQMQREGVDADSVTFLGLLNACASIGALEEGRIVHGQIIRSGFDSDPYVANSLIDMYAKCGSTDEAWRVLNKISARDVVAWNTIIQGCVKSDRGEEALALFQQMQRAGVEPNAFTFVGLLNACVGIVDLEGGRRVHEEVVCSGFESDVFVGNSLIDMYAKCGSIDDAFRVFNRMRTHDVVAWNSMIVGSVKCGHAQKALDLFQRMKQEGVPPNSVTFLGMLSGCARSLGIEVGRRLHEEIIQSGLESDVLVGNSLLDMYSKCGSMDDAWRVFDEMPIRTVVTWTAMILGYVTNGEGLNALQLFRQMQLEGVEPDSLTFVAILNACASIASLDDGKRVHEQIIQSGCESDVYVASSLIDMYAKSGSINDARKVFYNITVDNVVVWNAMIMGYAMHGLSNEAFALFERMSLGTSKVDKVTFVGILSACSHGGLVNEGFWYFESMWSVYKIFPTLEHYTCMVDTLGRAGQLDNAEAFVKTMPLEPCVAFWTSLLGACRIHGNVELGERVSKQILKLDPTNAAVCVLFSNICAAAGQWNIRAMEDRLM